MDKKNLRTQIRHHLNHLHQSQKELWSDKITNKVINDKLIKNSQTVGIYYSTKNEVNTNNIIEYLLKVKKKVCLPRVDNNNMMMHMIEDVNFAHQKNKGILEPLLTAPVCLPEQIDLLIIPGLAFDQFNYRLGQGGGYYDRYLHNFAGQTMMLIFSIQKVKKINRNKWDIPIKHIYTEL